MRQKRKSISVGRDNPHDIELHRDGTGLLHVTATNDLGALWGMGFAQAMDRGLQMLQMRVIGQGRICEQLADDEASLEVDKFFRRMNWASSVPTLDGLSEQDTGLAQAFCDGINAAFSRETPWELGFLGYKHEPWTLGDSILFTRMMGYVTLAQSQAEVERLFVELVQAGVSDERLAALFPVAAPLANREMIERVTLGERIVPEDVKWMGALPRLMASNNWVISGSKTRSGAAILANDPHLEINRLPNVWQELSVQWGDNHAIGMCIPGQPGISIGRNAHVAWGATYTFVDAVDSWVEDCREGQYRRGADDWREFEVRTETIRRKQNPDHIETIYANHHGVLDGDPRQTGHYLATRWASAESGTASLTVALATMRAKTTKDILEALKGVEVSFSWVAADTKGDIGFQMSGLTPDRKEGWNGFEPAPGWDASYDWNGFVDPETLPASLNPAEGYIVTANHDLNHLGQGKPINMPMGDYRAQRISGTLAASNDHDCAAQGRTQMDVFSVQAEAFMAVLSPLLPDSPQAQMLKDWDCCYDIESRGAVLFEQFYAELRSIVFSGGGVGRDVIDHLTGQTGIFIDFYAQFDEALMDEGSAWYRNLTREAAFRQAFEKACETTPDQTWGQSNTITLNNMLLGGKLPTSFGFDISGIQMPGGRATPHQGQKYTSGGRETTFAPGVRLVADMGDNLLRTTISGGPSDRRFSPWYASGLEKWLAGKFEVRPIQD
jgi:penicillin amidase